MEPHKRILGVYIVPKNDYHRLRKQQQELEEAKLMIEHTKIHEEKKQLEKQHADKIGKWYEDETGLLFQIKGLYYKEKSGIFGYSRGFYFEVWYPNQEDWHDVITTSLYDYKEITQEEAARRLGIKQKEE